MELPPEYRQEREAHRRRGAALYAAADAGRITQQALSRELLADFREFYERWAPRLQGTRELEWLEAARAEEMRDMELSLEHAWLASLQLAVDSRRLHLLHENVLRQDATWLGEIKNKHPEFNAYLRSLGQPELKEVDAAAVYRTSEARADESEKVARQDLDELAAGWPERVDAAIRERWEKLDVPGATAWLVEIQAQADALPRPRL